MLCRLFGKSRTAWYKQQKSIYRKVIKQSEVLSIVSQLRKKMPRIGTRKLHYILQNQGFDIGRDALFKLLRNHNMLVRRRRTRIFTTQSSHWLRKYPNIINDLIIYRPNQLWVSDITYVKSKEGHRYLFLLTDAYSRKILGYKLCEDMQADNAVSVLKMALAKLKKSENGLIHHSDRGIQYCSTKYVNLLKANTIRISMTENGDPLENAIAERVNGILKDEWLYNIETMKTKLLKSFIGRIIEIYNSDRPHLSIDMLTPNEAHKVQGKLKRKWKNYYNCKVKEKTLINQ